MKVCRCKSLSTIHGADAKKYAKEHLQVVSIDKENWVTIFVCPETGINWREEYPHSEYHGGGPPELIRID